jgi:hypothetical protein
MEVTKLDPPLAASGAALVSAPEMNEPVTNQQTMTRTVRISISPRIN